MLGPADIQIDATELVTAHPITFHLFTDKPASVMRITEAQVIPARAGPLRHGVCLAHHVAGITNPFFRSRQRRFARADRLVVLERRWHERQFLLVQGAVFAVFPNNRKWLTPITLTRK